jgi:hypothetical protein
MPVHLRLVHAEPGSRVVEASAVRQGAVLAMALGEASTAEAAEERARQRLQLQLADLQASGQTERSASAAAGAASTAPRPPTDQPRSQRAATAVAPVAVDAVAVDAVAVDADPATSPGVRAEEVAMAPVVEEPPPDPEDWSAELARIDLALKRIGWQREQEGLYLERAFGHPSRSRLTTYNDLLAYLRLLEQLETGCDPHTAPVPLRRSELLSQSDALLSQLGWNALQGKQFLEQQLGRASRQQLSESQLLQFNMLLEEALLAAAATAQAATVD